MQGSIIKIQNSNSLSAKYEDSTCLLFIWAHPKSSTGNSGFCGKFDPEVNLDEHVLILY